MSETTTLEAPAVVDLGPCVIYSEGVFGMDRLDCRAATMERGDYAQYKNIPLIRCKEKGRRKPRAFYVTGTRATIIVHPDNAVELPDPLADTGDGGRRSRHSSFSPQWLKEFRELIAGKPVIWDSEAQ